MSARTAVAILMEGVPGTPGSMPWEVDTSRLSDGERILVDLAQQFWNGMGTTTVYEAIARLDHINRARLLAAIEEVCR